jgi:hypothetical protein
MAIDDGWTPIKEVAMGARDMVQQYCQSLKDLIPSLHQHLIKALSDMAIAAILALNCHSGELAARMLGPAKPASRQRRIERLLANDHLNPAEAMKELARSLLEAWSGRRLLLILDETPKGQNLRCMKLSVGYHKRALPLAYRVYKPNRRRLDKLVLSMFRELAGRLPDGAEVTFLADRGLCWPSLIDFCTSHRWHYVLRMQGTTRVRISRPDGTRILKKARELAPYKGRFWAGSGQAFKKAGWREVNLVATWEKRCKEPWLLVTDLPASYARCRGYAKRNWCEQMHRDEKSGGFDWGKSHVNKPAHAARLLLIIALAMLLAISTGTRVIKQGLRKNIDSPSQRMLSIFKLGVRWIQHCLVNDERLPAGLYLYPP